jgi:hypothetical protein
MKFEQPEWEYREDRYWMKGIPRDWPITEKEPSYKPMEMTKKQMDNLTAQILDAYNDGKFPLSTLVLQMKELQKIKIKQ